ncbi:adenosylcobyric acid synthase, partial [Enterococcus lactis]|nr:adenosylcobyric acid synthase [Enterococcus lactis]
MAIYVLIIALLYGFLMITFGDFGFLLLLYYVADIMGVSCHTEFVSLLEPFDADYYVLVFFGGGLD